MNTIKRFSFDIKIKIVNLIIASIVIASLTSCSGNTKPPYYGVFAKKGQELLELAKRELLKIPVTGELEDMAQVEGNQPELIIWQEYTRLDYLDFYKLGKINTEYQEIKYNSKLGGDGIAEITFGSPLSDGEYCILQNDPLSKFFIAWCFRIGDAKASQPSFQTPTTTSTVISATKALSTETVLPEVHEEIEGMIFIPEGSFQMGCDQDRLTWFCGPIFLLHSVTLDSYYIDKYEVTNAQYAKCVEAGGCKKPTSNPEIFSNSSYSRTYYYNDPTYANFPVINVSWFDAANYCAWVGKRLPTEAEWEKAARGNNDTRNFPWGDQPPDCTLTNIDVYSTSEDSCVGDTSEVGSYQEGASPYGVMDMAGNVSEWVNDWYQEDYYNISPSTDPQGPEIGTYRIHRGGDWKSGVFGAHVMVRSKTNEFEQGSLLIGFRCAASP